MLFRRREPASMAELVRVLLWPRRSWSRSMRYALRRAARTRGSPHAIAIGFAAGVFAACTPYVGVQVVSALLIAWLLGGSLIASLLGTCIGNPLTYPLIWAGSYSIGRALLDDSPAGMQDGAGSGFAIIGAGWPMLKVMSVGALPIGVLAGAVCYCIVRQAVRSAQLRREMLLRPTTG